MEVNSVGSAADSLASLKQSEAQSKSILELGQDLKKARATDEETLMKLKNLESPKNTEANAANAAQGVKSPEAKETGGMLDLMG